MTSAVEEYLRLAREAGYREVRLIHGKGIGVRRAEMRRMLSRREDVAGFFDAPPGARRQRRDDRGAEERLAKISTLASAFARLVPRGASLNFPLPQRGERVRGARPLR